MVLGTAMMPFFNRDALAAMLGLSPDLIEDVGGGGFGARGEDYPEDFLIPFAATHVGRPVCCRLYARYRGLALLRRATSTCP
jgi:carbon-monoxide dehydrogenase large subunit